MHRFALVMEYRNTRTPREPSTADHQNTLDGFRARWDRVRGNAGGASDEVVAARLPYAERVRSLAQHAQAESVVFQSVAVTALQILNRARYYEHQVAEAALSLAHREKLRDMVAELDATARALRAALSEQGTQMLDLSTPEGARVPEGRYWWFALTEALQALEEGAGFIASVVSGQPKGGATRVLSSVIARLLHRHHNALLAEAESWID